MNLSNSHHWRTCWAPCPIFRRRLTSLLWRLPALHIWDLWSMCWANVTLFLSNSNVSAMSGPFICNTRTSRTSIWTRLFQMDYEALCYISGDSHMGLLHLSSAPLQLNAKPLADLGWVGDLRSLETLGWCCLTTYPEPLIPLNPGSVWHFGFPLWS